MKVNESVLPSDTTQRSPPVIKIIRVLWSDWLILNLKIDMVFCWLTDSIWNCSWCLQLPYKTVQRSLSGWQKEQLSLSTVKKNGYCTQHQLIGMEGRATWRSPRSTKRKQFFDNGDLSNEKGKQFRACEKAGCPASKPTCCARFDETWVTCCNRV